MNAADVKAEMMEWASRKEGGSRESVSPYLVWLSGFGWAKVPMTLEDGLMNCPTFRMKPGIDVGHFT